MANIHSTITYNANLSAAQAQIKALTAQIGTLAAAFNTLDKSALTAQRSLAATFAAGVGQTGGFTTSTVKATSAVETFGKQLAANRLTMRDYFREAITGYTRQNSMMRRLAEQQVRYQQSIAVPVGGGQAMMMTPQSINLASNAAALASQRFAVFNQLMNGGATAMLNWGKNTQWAGRQLMVGFTVPLMLFTAVASKQFRELDKELTRFQKVYGADLGNAISDSTERMREQVKQLAYDISSTYGVAAKDTAALAADIAATGREGEALISSVQQTTRLAVLGEVDRQEAMKATLSLQSAFRMNTNELAESINFLNAVENQTSATLEDLATAIPKVGPVVRSLGGDVKDLATLLVAMREGGIPAAEAANALKSGLSALINPTKQASDVARQFGIDLVGIVEANRGQLMPTIYAMQEALGGLDSFGRSRVIEQIFGRYQFARITALFDNIGRAGSQTQSVVELASKSSAELAKVANDELRTLTESTAMRFQRTMEDLKNAIMPIGQTLTETLIPIFEFIGSGMKTLTSFFQSLPGPVKDFAKYGVAIAALAGPVIMLVGLFGNLIANGIKFGMMMTRLGARIAGVKVEKFELLNHDVMAAKLGVDGLTKSFDTQEVALRRLTGVLTSYEASLRRLTTSNPALFIPGALPAARGQVPIRRQAGSTRPEFVPGSGRGDKIPAMLEPGEFIVNRAATEKYAPVLMEMNRGTLQGFQRGTQLSHLTLSKQQSVGSLLQLPFLDQGARAMLMLIQSIHGVDFQVRTYSNAVIGLSTSLNQSMERGQASIELFRREISDAGTAFDPLKEQLRVLIAETGEFGSDMNLAEQAVNSFAQQMRAQASGFKGRTFNAAQLESMTMAALAGVADPRQRAALTRLLDTPTAFSAGRGLTASNMYLFGQAAGVPMYTAGEGSSRRIYANIGPEQYLGVRPKAERIPLGNMPTYQGAQISPLSLALPVGATRLQDPGSSPTMYDETGRRITKSVARALGGTKLELFEKQIQPSAEQFVDNLARIFARTLARVLESSSPSKRMDREVAREGKNFGDGAASGFIKGYRSSAAGKPIIAGPVGGTGIESISNAQKIAQADKTILEYKKAEQLFASRRSIAQQQIAAIDAEILRLRELERSGKITAGTRLAKEILLLEERNRYDRELIEAKKGEKKWQDKINEQKQKIAQADQAQLKAEQEEARAAQRRASAAAAPIFGMGPGGSMGYFRGGTSPYAAPKDTSSPGPNRPTGPTGPAVALGAARDQAQGGMRGMNAMNAVFALSMVTSSISMMGGASADAAMKLGLFTTALMTATMMMNMGLGKNTFMNFLGMRSLGGKLGQTNAARLAANPALAQRASSIAAAGGLAGGRMAGQGAAAGLAAGGGRMGATLLGASRVLSVAGGPIGIAAGIGITAAVTGFMMYRNAAEEARERAIAAFNDPVKSAEYFGETIQDVSRTLENNRLSNISKDLGEIDQALRDAVRQDYEPLIQQIKFLSAGAGAQELSMAYSNMIISGMSAENAKAAIQAIAVEAGMSGGRAFAEAVSQGMLDESLTVKDAVNNIIGQFTPAETLFGTSGRTILGTLESERDALLQERSQIESRITYGPAGTYGPPAQIMTPEDQQRLYEIENALDGINDEIEDLITVNPEMISSIMDSLVMAYQQDPTAAIEGIEKFSETISKLGEDDQAAAMVKITEYLKNAYGEEWTNIGHKIDTQQEKIIAVQMAISGVSLSKAINDAGEFDASLARAVVTAKSLADATRLLRIEAEEEYFSMIGDFAQKQRDQINLNFENFSNAMETRIELYEGLKEGAQESFEAEQEARQDSIEGMQDEMDQRRRAFDEEMQRLDDRKNAIEKSSEAYINSLERNQKAESFYAQQRKTAFGALEKLASGDVFGFLQERQQMSTDAQEFSYDQMISGIEERRDLELDAIDEVREKKQREQEEYEQMMEDRIKGVQDLMELEQEAHDDRMKFYDDQIERANTAKENAIENKNEEIDKIENIEKDYRDNSTRAEETYSKEYAELKTKPYVEARKEMLRLRIEEIYYRGGVTLATAAVRAGALSSPARGRSAAMGIEEVLKDLGFINRASDIYRTENVGDTGVGDTQAVRDMTVDAEEVTLNGDIIADGINLTPGAATGGYIQNGRVNLQDGGGAVKGPGGPKSDVIPAMLSNGEYVIQASSVSKYGKEMMDTINAGKFAGGGPISTSTAAAQAQSTYRGALPGPMMLYSGGYISADRRETAASGNQYLGGVKPKTTYSGGTPTWSSGYNKANQQAYTNIYNQKNNIKVGKYGWRGDASKFNNRNKSSAGSGFSLMYQGISGAIEKDGLWPTLESMASAIAADPASLVPFYGLSGIDTSTQEGKDMQSAAALMEILGIIPGIGLPFKAMAMAGRTGLRSTGRASMDALEYLGGGVGRANANVPTSVRLKLNNLLTEDRGAFSLLRPKSSTRAPFEVPEGYELSVNRTLGTTVGSIYRNRSLTTYLHPEVMRSKEGFRMTAALAEHKERMRVENRFLGIPKNAPWTERPIYGYLRKPGTYEEGYGNVTLDINPNIASKITTSLGDSFNEGFFARPENLNITHTAPEGKSMRELQIYSGGEIPFDPSGIKRATLRLNDPWHNKVPSKEIHPDSLSMQVKTFSDAIAFISKMKNVEVPSRVLFNGRPVSEFFLRQLHSRKTLELRAAMARLKEHATSPDALYANGGLVQKFAEGGLVESINKFFPQGGHQFYPGWNKYNSWSKGKPQLITMHHTALLPGVSQQAELDAFAKDWKGKPVVQSWIGKSGVAHTLAAGNTGYGMGDGTTKYMKGETEFAKELIDVAGHPNSLSWQMEVSSAGKTKDFTSGQFDAIARMTAAIREWAGWPGFEGRIINHKDWAGYRTDGTARNDTLYPISTFVQNANKIWEQGGGSTSGENDGGENGKGGKGSGGRNNEKLASIKLPTMSGSGRKILAGKADPSYVFGKYYQLGLPTGDTPGGTGGNQGKDNQPRRGITLDPKDYQSEIIDGYKLVKLIYGSGWKTKDEVRKGYGVVWSESNGNRKALREEQPGMRGQDWGLWQINDYWHPEVGGEKVDFGPNIFDAIYNTKIARKIYEDPKNHGGATQTPWGSWNGPIANKSGYEFGLQAFDNNPNWWRQLVTETGGSNNGGDGGSPGTVPAAKAAVNFIRAQVGDRYVAGAAGPDSWDCSNLTAAAWNHATQKQVLGVPSSVQANQITRRVVGLKDGQISGVMPGDVLYFAPKGVGVLPGHTSMYVGNDSVVEASSPATGVRVSSLNNPWNTGIGKFKWAGPPKGYAAGGFISGAGGPTSDSIPAMLSNGEYVIKASSVRKYGKGVLDRINAGQMPVGQNIKPIPLGRGGRVGRMGYASGGLVGSMPSPPASGSLNMSSNYSNPMYNVPENNRLSSNQLISMSDRNSMIAGSSSNNSSRVKIVINGGGRRSSKAIANEVARIIRSSNSRRDFSRSAG